MFRVLSLNGNVAFDQKTAAIGFGAVLLFGIAATHAYILATQQLLPWYLVVYAIAVIGGCLLAAGSMRFGRNPRATRAGWYFGDLLSVAFLGVAISTRVTSLPGLAVLTGRWDIMAAILALVCAAAFIALHASVLAGTRVAYRKEA